MGVIIFSKRPYYNGNRAGFKFEKGVASGRNLSKDLRKFFLSRGYVVKDVADGQPMGNLDWKKRNENIKPEKIKIEKTVKN